MQNNIQVVYQPIASLIPADYNPRKHTKEQAEQLKESIRRFGNISPVICNQAPGRENVIIGGNFRAEMAKELGIEQVPVVYVDIPDLEKEKELNLRLNKNQGEFDIEKLGKLDFDLLIDVGFTSDTLLEITLEQVQKILGDNFDPEAELAKIKEPQTKLGDIIEMGSSKLICGDSVKPETLQKLFGDERASMIMSDPLYNISVNYNTGIGGKQQYGGMVDDNKSDSEYHDFLKKSMQAALAVTKEDAHVFYWSDQTYIWLIQTLYRELGIINKRVCLWLKNSQNPVPSIAFNKCYEPCTYGVRGKPSITKSITNLNEVMNKDMTTGNSLLREAQDHFDVWPVRRLAGKDYEHSTMKPPEVYYKAIRRCTEINDIILDSFSGSGSTLIAGVGLKRRVYAVEIEPAFCDLTIRRYEALYGGKAKVIRDGEAL